MARGKKKPVESAFLTLGSNASAVLKGYVDNLDALDEKIQELGKQKKDIFLTAKNNGFNTKPLKEIMRRRKLADATRISFAEELLSMEKALGMLPLFEYADSLDSTGKSTEQEADDLVNS